MFSLHTTSSVILMVKRPNELSKHYVLAVVQEILEGVTDIDLVVNLKLREEALLAKCLGRRTCSECGGNYNVACIDIKGEDGSPGMYMAPLLPPPHCASKLITRPDDTEEVVKERLRIYYEMVLLHTLKCSLFNIFLLKFFFIIFCISKNVKKIESDHL